MRQKLLQKHDEKIKLFEESIKSEQTRKVYLHYFKKYMEHLGSKFNINESDPKKIEQSIIDYIILLKKTKSYSAVHNYVSAITAFYRINDIMLNANKIKRFNLIGFRDFDRPNFAYDDYVHCGIHNGVRCFPDPKDEKMMICPECGISYKKNETVKVQNIESKFDPNSSTKIIQAKKKRKHYDNFGTLIPEDDPIAIKESLGAGFKKLIYYQEDKKGEEYHTVKK